MARSKATLKNIDKSDPSNYLEGRIKDNTGSGGGTPVNEYVYGDLHQTFAKLMAMYNIKYNGLPDNETNGYQLIEALIGLASKNDFVLPITSNGGKLNLQLKLGSLKAGESVLCRAAVNKGAETEVKGTLDNVSKAATFKGDFKTGDFVQVINNADNLEFVRLVSTSNFEAFGNLFKFLKAATQTQENAGSSDQVATTPKTNKSVFEKRVNGTDSDNYLATEDQNGLLSKEDKAILNNIGQSRIRNIGAFSGLDVDSDFDGFVIHGDIIGTTRKDRTSEGQVIRVKWKNAMDNTNYKLHLSIQSQGNFNSDNDILPPVWRPYSTTEADIYFEEVHGTGQNLKIHIDVIQLQD